MTQIFVCLSMFVSLSDTLHLASKLTFKRVLNAFTILISFYWSKMTKKSRILGLPISLSIEPTTACNLGCPECPSGLKSFTRPTGKINIRLYEKIIEELAPTLTYLILYFQGEPFLHPEFIQLIKKASERKIYTATSSNAHFLTDKVAQQTVESGLDRLIVSIDGTTQEIYESYRKNGKLSKVLEGTENVIAWKKKSKSKTPEVVWQFLVVRPNEHQVNEAKELAKAYEVDKIAFKTAQVYDYVNGNELIPINEKYSRYKKRSDGTYVNKQNISDECWKMWHSCVITWDGKVVPCCFDKDAQYELGQVGEQDFKDVWYSNAYHQFRQQLITSRSQIEMCKNCSEGSKVWA